jgi:tetratricopeptide (TPR) repeat protein
MQKKAVNGEFLEILENEQVLKYYISIGRCLYTKKMYKQAIYNINLGLKIDRHFPGIHKYKVLSQLKLGLYDDALGTASQAVIYETPWDPENQALNLALYDDLYAKHKKK